MSDQEFDNLVEELRAVDPGNQILTKVGWGYDISKSSLKKCNHKYGVVGSLNTIKDANQAAEFSRRSAIITPKLDGISLVAYCSKGILDRILTRAEY